MFDQGLDAYHRDREEDGTPAVPVLSDGNRLLTYQDVWFGYQPATDGLLLGTEPLTFSESNPMGASSGSNGHYFALTNEIAAANQTTVRNELHGNWEPTPDLEYTHALAHLLDMPVPSASSSTMTQPLGGGDTDGVTPGSSNTKRQRRVRKAGPKVMGPQKRKYADKGKQMKIVLHKAARRRNALRLFAVVEDIRREIENQFFAILMRDNFFPDTNQADTILLGILDNMGHCESRLRTLTFIRSWLGISAPVLDQDLKSRVSDVPTTMIITHTLL
jgi:hypothetical protein